MKEPTQINTRNFNYFRNPPAFLNGKYVRTIGAIAVGSYSSAFGGVLPIEVAIFDISKQ